MTGREKSKDMTNEKRSAFAGEHISKSRKGKAGREQRADISFTNHPSVRKHINIELRIAIVRRKSYLVTPTYELSFLAVRLYQPRESIYVSSGIFISSSIIFIQIR